MSPRIFNCIVAAVLFSASTAAAQYAPAATVPGTTAMYKDSSAFVAWATECTVVRGWQDISNTSLGLVSVGDSSMALGLAGSNGVVSLGDGGYATMEFENPIGDGPGWDFAVFENSFDDSFLELAFVEISSDGVSFFRFPSHSLTDTSVQTGSFGATDPTKINNLAGKYRALYGTPFDLAEMSNIPGLDIQQITHVRVVDVVGNIAPQYTTRDTANNPVNDPWPTAFSSGGFDLDAVGVIHENPVSVYEFVPGKMSVYPNPSAQTFGATLEVNAEFIGGTYTIVNPGGAVVVRENISADKAELGVGLNPGIYFIIVENNLRREIFKWVITE